HVEPVEQVDDQQPEDGEVEQRHDAGMVGVGLRHLLAEHRVLLARESGTARMTQGRRRVEPSGETDLVCHDRGVHHARRCRVTEPPKPGTLEMPEPTGGPGWYELGSVEALADRPVREVRIGRLRLALTYRDGAFGAISGVCNHVGGPLGEGTLEGEYVVCPWHYWRFERTTGAGEPGYEADRVPSHRVEVREGRVWVDLVPATKRGRLPHKPHALAREPVRAPGPPRVAGISTTVMDTTHPRYST